MKHKVKKHIGLLGLEVEDKVTKAKGYITSISFDLFGCIQAIITPEIGKDMEVKCGVWMDVNRLKILSKKPVMKVPDFDYGPIADGKQGAAAKPPMI